MQPLKANCKAEAEADEARAGFKAKVDKAKATQLKLRLKPWLRLPNATISGAPPPTMTVLSPTGSYFSSFSDFKKMSTCSSSLP